MRIIQYFYNNNNIENNQEVCSHLNFYFCTYVTIKTSAFILTGRKQPTNNDILICPMQRIYRDMLSF